jgi:tetraacyldisaccharide-1-P 4'-kinase
MAVVIAHWLLIHRTAHMKAVNVSSEAATRANIASENWAQLLVIDDGLQIFCRLHMA